MINLFTYALSKKGAVSAAAGSEVDLSDYATKEEISDFITEDALADYAKKNEIRAYIPFNPNWRYNKKIKDFCSDIDNDPDVYEGMIFVGELRCSDFRTTGVPLTNGEAIVDIMASNGVGGGKTIHITLTSGDTYPYKWEYTYWSHGNKTHGWVGFYPIMDDKIPASALTPEARTTFTPDEEKIILHSQTEDSEKMFSITVNDDGELTATEITE